MSSFTLFVDLSHESNKYSFVRSVGKHCIRMVQNMKITWALEVSNHIMVKLFWTST